MFSLSTLFSDQKCRHELISALEALFRERVQQEPGPPATLPGMASCVYFGDDDFLQVCDGFSNPTDQDLVLNRLHGHANMDPVEIPAHARIEPEMLFEIGSITKTFTAATILRFLQNGAIQLEDELKAWMPSAVFLPGLNYRKREDGSLWGPTIHDLLRMTSGIFDFNDGVYEAIVPPTSHPGEAWFQRHIDEHEPDRFWLPTAAYDHLHGHEPFCEPGQKFLYSSTNYVILGNIATTLANYYNLADVYRVLSNAAQLKDMYLGGYESLDNGRRVMGWNNGKPAHERRAFVTAYWAGGGMISNAENTAKWAYQLLQPDVVLSADTLEKMHGFYTFDPPIETDHGVTDFYIKGYGLGLTWFQVTEEPGADILEAEKAGKVINLYGHAGGSWAFLSFTFYDPDRDLSFALLGNAHSPAEFTALTRDYARCVAQHIPKK